MKFFLLKQVTSHQQQQQHLSLIKDYKRDLFCVTAVAEYFPSVESVWPDVRIKSSPFLQKLPKHRCIFYKIALNWPNILATFVRNFVGNLSNWPHCASKTVFVTRVKQKWWRLIWGGQVTWSKQTIFTFCIKSFKVYFLQGGMEPNPGPRLDSFKIT